MRYLKDVYDACLREECPRVLIEETLEGPGLSVAEVFWRHRQGERAGLARRATDRLRRHEPAPRLCEDAIRGGSRLQPRRERACLLEHPLRERMAELRVRRAGRTPLNSPAH